MDPFGGVKDLSVTGRSIKANQKRETGSVKGSPTGTPEVSSTDTPPEGNRRVVTPPPIQQPVTPNMIEKASVDKEVGRNDGANEMPMDHTIGGDDEEFKNTEEAVMEEGSFVQVSEGDEGKAEALEHSPEEDIMDLIRRSRENPLPRTFKKKKTKEAEQREKDIADAKRKGKELRKQKNEASTFEARRGLPKEKEMGVRKFDSMSTDRLAQPKHTKEEVEKDKTTEELKAMVNKNKVVAEHAKEEMTVVREDPLHGRGKEIRERDSEPILREIKEKHKHDAKVDAQSRAEEEGVKISAQYTPEVIRERAGEPGRDYEANMQNSVVKLKSKMKSMEAKLDGEMTSEAMDKLEADLKQAELEFQEERESYARTLRESLGHPATGLEGGVRNQVMGDRENKLRTAEMMVNMMESQTNCRAELNALNSRLMKERPPF
jgi:hypothetical protein